MLSITFCSFAQDNQLKKIRLSYIDLSTGRGVLGSGFYATFGINHYGNLAQITMAEEKIFFNYFFKAKSLKVGPSLGSFQNVPFGGVIANWVPLKYFSNLFWAGYSFGEPLGKVSLSPSFLFLVNTASVEMWMTKLSYSVVFFQKNLAKHVLTLRYSQKIESRMLVYADIAYDFTNKTQLIKLGVNIKM